MDVKKLGLKAFEVPRIFGSRKLNPDWTDDISDGLRREILVVRDTQIRTVSFGQGTQIMGELGQMGRRGR